MGEKEQNVAYSPSMWSKRFKTGEEAIEDFVAVSQKASANARDLVDHELDIPYGPTENQKIDVYGAQSLPPGSPVFVFVHGGYWVAGCRQDSAVMVKPLFDAGIITVALGYDLAPSVSLDEIVKEITEGIKYMEIWAERRSSKIWLCGSSAGAHLISMALSLQAFKNIAGVILVSGVYDLIPLMKTYVASDAGFDREMAFRNSPQTRVEAISTKNQTKFLVVSAEHDPPAFRNQSQEFLEELFKNGIDADKSIIENVDHFNIITNLENADFKLTKEIIQLLKNSS